jgi:hypothetical protein
MTNAANAKKAPRKILAIAKGTARATKPAVKPPVQRVVALDDERINHDLVQGLGSLEFHLRDARKADRLLMEGGDDTDVHHEQTMLDHHSARFENAHNSLVRMLHMLVGDNGAIELPDGTIVGVQSTLVSELDFNQLFVVRPENIIRLDV